MKNAIKILSLFSLLLLATASFTLTVSAQTETEILIVADQKAKCGFTGRDECLQVKSLFEEKFRLIYQSIERFSFEPGYFYVLDVQAVRSENASTSETGSLYRLKRILARVKSEKTEPHKPSGLFGTRWKLTRIEGKPVYNDQAFIRFDNKKKSAGGNGGCNVFGGDFDKNGSRIAVSNVISTKMFCENGSDVESEFLGNLERVNTYKIKGNKLFLMSGRKVLLEFKAESQ